MLKLLIFALSHSIRYSNHLLLHRASSLQAQTHIYCDQGYKQWQGNMAWHVFHSPASVGDSLEGLSDPLQASANLLSSSRFTRNYQGWLGSALRYLEKWWFRLGKHCALQHPGVIALARSDRDEQKWLSRQFPLRKDAVQVKGCKIWVVEGDSSTCARCALVELLRQQVVEQQDNVSRLHCITRGREEQEIDSSGHCMDELLGPWCTDIQGLADKEHQDDTENTLEDEVIFCNSWQQDDNYVCFLTSTNQQQSFCSGWNQRATHSYRCWKPQKETGSVSISDSILRGTRKPIYQPTSSWGKSAACQESQCETL